MDATAQQKEFMKGGAFLIENRTANEIFTPEDFTDEQRMIGDTTREFVDNEVTPKLEAMENHDWEVARELVEKAGDLGLLGATIPEEYGGLGAGPGIGRDYRRIRSGAAAVSARRSARRLRSVCCRSFISVRKN